ncbi:protein phosphatase 2C domain-containing protein [Nocardioides flavescens]|uniref:Serine/threonine-protein phosphatase n=1 Tax=Nocardioides flavescens TaxID=2691959 RepID=A0A6L7F0Y3_9ACTN|nr:serine/threonine-protein phosphatase [Nocardioides flavescens]
MHDETRPLVAGQMWAPPLGPVLDAGGASDAGTHRRTNEDSYLVAPPVFVVADGMGGHAAGDVASGIVVEVFDELVRRGAIDAESVRAGLARAAELIEQLPAGSGRQAPGSTVALAAHVEEDGVPYWCLASIGDSRTYLLADGHLTQVSRDHSVVQELIDDGQLTAAAARSHPERHVITRALGATLSSPADFAMLPVEPGTRLLLCSDGVSTPLSHAAILEVVGAGQSAPETASRLVATALAAGGRDNATALVVDVRPDGGHIDDDTIESASALANEHHHATRVG